MNTFSHIWTAKWTTRKCVLFEPTLIFVGNAVPHLQNWKLKQRRCRVSSQRDRTMQSLDLFMPGTNFCNGGTCLNRGGGSSPETFRNRSQGISCALSLHRLTPSFCMAAACSEYSAALCT